MKGFNDDIYIMTQEKGMRAYIAIMQIFFPKENQTKIFGFAVSQRMFSSLVECTDSVGMLLASGSRILKHYSEKCNRFGSLQADIDLYGISNIFITNFYST